MKILYFAWIRDKVGYGEETTPPPDSVQDINALVAHLKSLSKGHAEAFTDMSAIRAAVNQEFVPLTHPLEQGDEVAFFPPVTGG